MTLLPGHLGHEDDHLVELESIQKVIELAVLLGLLQTDEVLLQAVQGQLRVIVHKDLHRLLEHIEHRQG